MSKLSLLYLEDDEALAAITRRGLERYGFVVSHAADLVSFANLLPIRPYDCALLDLKISHDSSLALIPDIQAHITGPIVVLTGYGTVKTAVQAIKLGACDFLTKPVGIHDIVQALTQCQRESFEIATETMSRPSLKSQEWEAIQQALDDNDGNVSAAARQLKMHRRTLQRKLQKKHLAGDPYADCL